MKLNKNQKKLIQRTNNFEVETVRTVLSIMKEVGKRTQEIIDVTYREYRLPKLVDGIPDGAATSAFMNTKIKTKYGYMSRLTKMKIDIKNAVAPLLLKRDKYIEQRSKEQYMNAYYTTAWTMRNTVKRNIKVKKLTDKDMVKKINDNPKSVFKSEDL